MARVEDYRAYAKQYFVRAQEADSEELRRASLEMASYWMEAAMRTESSAIATSSRAERCLVIEDQ